MVESMSDFSLDINVFNSDDLREATRLFEWALSFERKGLLIAAEALRDEGRKSYERFLAHRKAG